MDYPCLETFLWRCFPSPGQVAQWYPVFAFYFKVFYTALLCLPALALMIRMCIKRVDAQERHESTRAAMEYMVIKRSWIKR